MALNTSFGLVIPNFPQASPSLYAFQSVQKRRGQLHQPAVLKHFNNTYLPPQAALPGPSSRCLSLLAAEQPRSRLERGRAGGEGSPPPAASPRSAPTLPGPCPGGHRPMGPGATRIIWKVSGKLLGGSLFSRNSTCPKEQHGEADRVTDWQSCRSNSHLCPLVMGVVSAGVVPSLASALCKAEN